MQFEKKMFKISTKRCTTCNESCNSAHGGGSCNGNSYRQPFCHFCGVIEIFYYHLHFVTLKSYTVLFIYDFLFLCVHSWLFEFCRFVTFNHNYLPCFVVFVFVYFFLCSYLFVFCFYHSSVWTKYFLLGIAIIFIFDDQGNTPVERLKNT